MKKRLLLIITKIILSLSFSYSQNDTLIWTDFSTDPAAYIQFGVLPPGLTSDTSWYNLDVDMQQDGSGSGRPLEWFWTNGFAPADSGQMVLASSSWTNNPVATDNWLITKSITISDSNAVLSWASAPYQTPRYVDGYFIFISTTTNDYNAFSDTIFQAAEYLSLNNSSAANLFSSYTFTNGFVHGQDSTYTILDPTSDSSRLLGVLRPFSASLKQYAGKNIFIAFDHHSIDDNFISIDNILVTGTKTVGINEESREIKSNAYPNPAFDRLYLDLTITSETNVTIEIFDIIGRKVWQENLGNLTLGKQYHSINVSELATGTYEVQIISKKGISNFKVQVK